ncbi:MAG: HAMP domain-containing histidine kinase [Spirochaetaceae bacterium]|nr:HAMP domain-containing histidine kinase [Spirochaetaceae bacterium]
MNSTARLQNLLRIGIIVAGTLLVAAAILLVLRKGQYDQLEAEYAASQHASLLVEQYVETGRIEELPADVVGFGVYDWNGDSLYREGSAPESIHLPELAEEIQRTNGQLRLLRPIGSRMPAGSLRGQHRASIAAGTLPAPGERESDRFVLLDYDLSVSVRRHQLENAALIGSGALTAAVLILVTLLFGRLQRVQRAQADQQRLARLGEAARTLAHEIRNPLTAAQMQTALLRRTIPSRHHDRLSVLDEELARIRNLTDQVREFLKSGAGNPISLDPYVVAVELAERLPFEVVVSAPERPVEIQMDPQRFRSILTNLLQNGADAGSPEDVVEIRISEHRTLRQGMEIQIVVADRGSGISEADRERIFDPFYTTKTHGSGVGLAVTRRFVEEAGGTIAVHNRNGGGTEMIVRVRGNKDESSDR